MKAYDILRITVKPINKSEGNKQRNQRITSKMFSILKLLFQGITIQTSNRESIGSNSLATSVKGFTLNCKSLTKFSLLNFT